MQDYIDKQTGLLNSDFFNPISNSEINKNWYVVTNNTSWCNVERAIYSGPHATEEIALEHCKFNGFPQSDRWVESLTPEEAQAITY